MSLDGGLKALAFNVSVPSDGLQGRSRLEKPLHKWLDGSDEAWKRLKYVPWGPGGVGKSTLGLKFAAGQAERGGGWLRLVFRLSASSNTRGSSTRWARAPGGRRVRR